MMATGSIAPGSMMHDRILLILSAVLNGCLLIYLSHAHQPPDRPPGLVLLAPSNGEPHGSGGDQTNLFRAAMADLAQERFKRAVVDLRRAGLPESSIQDVILGFVNRQYGPKILALRKTVDRYWEPVQRHKLDEDNAEMQRESQARSLEAERAQLLQAILGVDWPWIEAQVTGKPDRFEKYTDLFEPPSRPKARQILASFDQLERDVIRRANGTLGSPERAELDRLYHDKLQQLRTFLSAGEVEEFELRTSWTAEHLKQIDLVGFAPTEDEFRAIFRVRKAFDEREAENTGDGANIEDRSMLVLAQAQLDEQLRNALGTARYAEYRRSQDYTFRALVELADEFDLGAAAAPQAHALRESVLEQVRHLNEDLSIAAVDRQQCLRELHSHTEDVIRNLLGAGAYRKYTGLQAGSWIHDILQP